MVREVRAAIGDERRLTLDANGGWTVPAAREAIRRLDPFEIFYYEDPVETQEELVAAARPHGRVVLDAPDRPRQGDRARRARMRS